MFKRPGRTEQHQERKPVSKNDRRWIVAAILGAFIVGLIIALGYFLPGKWGGFAPYETPKNDSIDYHPGKTLWDILSLLVIPAFLLVAGALFTRFERDNDNRLAGERAELDRELADKRAEKDRELAATNLRDAALREYFDRMSDLLLSHNLAGSSAEDPVRDVARIRTLTILRTLIGDAERKGSVVRFLYEADLIRGGIPIVSLGGADLQGADLHMVCLRGADLHMACLQGVDLQKANLQKANLQEADLQWAHLQSADLQEANLLKANLQEAHLQWANLQKANLQGADLQWARLQKANLKGADLYMTDLRRAYLQWAMITQEQLLQASDLDNAALPDGTIYYSPQPEAKPNPESDSLT